MEIIDFKFAYYKDREDRLQSVTYALTKDGRLYKYSGSKERWTELSNEVTPALSSDADVQTAKSALGRISAIEKRLRKLEKTEVGEE